MSVLPQFPAGLERMIRQVEIRLEKLERRTPAYRRGTATLAWPGAAARSTLLTETHGCGFTPSIVLVTVGGGSTTRVPTVQCDTIGATTFRLFADTIDGELPAADATTTVMWLAVA